jgi:hypothetical protein
MAFEELDGTALISLSGANQLIHCYDPVDKRILIVLPEDISQPQSTRTPSRVQILTDGDYDSAAITGPWEKTLGQPCVLHSHR